MGSIPGKGNRMDQEQVPGGRDPMGRTKRDEIKSDEQRSGHAKVKRP